MGTLKTQFPLLALSMEMLVDQLYQRFKAPPEEDVYRLISALLQEALSVSPRFGVFDLPGTP
jgi:transformation/transcription domain-associated protein